MAAFAYREVHGVRTLMLKKTVRALVLFVALAVPGTALAGGVCRIYHGTVDANGESESLSKNTPTEACIARQDGTCDARGRYLKLRNNSHAKVLQWRSPQVSDLMNTIGVDETVIAPLTRYSDDADTPPIRLSIVVCED